MNCPRCGNELRISKKDPSYGLCDECRKKFKLPETAPEEKTISKKKARPKREEKVEHYPKYANIPPEKVRKKRENEMRKAYDELLAIGEEERREKKKRFLFF